jgi:hypothetical protein
MQTSATFFDRLLQAAAAQAQPQRLLFVFAQSELPGDATPAQRVSYEAGRGGALVPLVCVDKSAAELASFDALVEESRSACPPWQAVFIGALSGSDGAEPSAERVEAALRTMVDNVRAGRLDGYMALDPDGDPLRISSAD